MLFVAVSTVNAQSVTYIHENDIMNQFLTMETGAGALTPLHITMRFINRIRGMPM